MEEFGLLLILGLVGAGGVWAWKKLQAPGTPRKLSGPGHPKGGGPNTPAPTIVGLKIQVWYEPFLSFALCPLPVLGPMSPDTGWVACGLPFPFFLTESARARAALMKTETGYKVNVVWEQLTAGHIVFLYAAELLSEDLNVVVGELGDAKKAVPIALYSNQGSDGIDGPLGDVAFEAGPSSEARIAIAPIEE